MGETADSDEAVVLPTDHDEAEEFREARPGARFWCGTYQGGCGKRLYIRTPGHCVAHFYHQSSDPKRPCRRLTHNRGRRDNDPVIALNALRTWRKDRGLTEESVEIFDPRKDADSRYLHITGPSGSRHTRVVVGDCAAEELIQAATSARAHEWDWFVHHANNVMRHLLDKNGVSFGVIQFSDTGSTTTMLVSATEPPGIGGWRTIEHYVPVPNRPRPTPPKPPAPRVPRSDIPRPTTSPIPDPEPRPKPLLEPHRPPAPAPTPPRAPKLELALPDKLRDAALRLDDAVILKDRRSIERYARNLHRLWQAHKGRLAPDDEQWIKNLLGQVGRIR